jgi:hypothetical protein
MKPLSEQEQVIRCEAVARLTAAHGEMIFDGSLHKERQIINCKV